MALPSQTKKFLFRAYLYQASLVGIGISSINAYNNFQIVREFNEEKRVHFCKNDFAHTLKSYTVPVFLCPVAKGLIYGLMSPISPLKMGWDKHYYKSVGQHLCFDYSLFSETKWKLVRDNRLLGIRPTDCCEF